MKGGRLKRKLTRIHPGKFERARGRIFTSQELRDIREIVNRHQAEGRTAISRYVCMSLDWRQPNGWLKDRACREALRILEARGYFRLPPSKVKKKKGEPRRKLSFIDRLDRSPLRSVDFSGVTLKQVKGTKEEEFWNWLVNKYHYLGFTVFVGRSIKYLIYYGDRVIGAIGFCDPAWNLLPRDALLMKLGIPRSVIHQRGINNGRFLILPWVRVKNLASFVLSVSAKKVVSDWTSYYSVSPLFIETFVNSRKFLGTCYKAANWIYLGKTKGFKKSGSAYMNSQVPKFIYIYPIGQLHRNKVQIELEKTDGIPK